jgi:hypothetical protein
MSGVTVATMIRSIGQSSDRSRLGNICERLFVGRETPLANTGALDDPLVRGVHELLEILVREDTVRDIHTEARDSDSLSVG